MLVTEERKIQDSKGFQTSDYWSRSSRRKRAAKKIVEANNVEVEVGVSKLKEEDYDEAICGSNPKDEDEAIRGSNPEVKEVGDEIKDPVAYLNHLRQENEASLNRIEIFAQKVKELEILKRYIQSSSKL